MSTVYQMIPQGDFYDFRKQKEAEGFLVRGDFKYTDGTMKVCLEKIPPRPCNPESPEEWEATRQRYLREAQTTERPWEGFDFGYLSEKDSEDILLAANIFAEPGVDYDFLEARLNSTREKKRTIRRKRKNGTWLFGKIQRWQKEWENPELPDPEGEVLVRDSWGYGHFVCKTLYNPWKQPEVRSLSGLVKKLSLVGLLANVTNLSEEDTRDYAGHAFGLFNTGCCSFNPVSEKLELEPVGTFNYIEEHFSRRLMSADVALEFLRKIQLLPRKRDYLGLSEYEKIDFVFDAFEKAKHGFLGVKGKEARERRERVEQVREAFPEVFEVFGECNISFAG